MAYRERLVHHLKIITSGANLLAYEKNVPIAYVPLEIVEQFFDFFHPKEPSFISDFSETELIDICIFSGYLDIAADEMLAAEQPPVSKVLLLPRWREMMKYGAKLFDSLMKG